MRGVGPGTMLGGRYTVHQRLEQVRDTERWTADDTTLGRSVSVLTLAADDPRTPALLDAARRAASVNHSVFVRILDVGTDGDVAFLVEEDLSDARTLTEVVGDGGIPGDEVRRITGEVAAALESARQRGMHHLDLTPDDVLRTPEGEVRLRGLEVAAARAAEEATDPEDAARRDAVGVVALAYAGLTGLWPLGSGGAGLGPAPRVPSGVASPSEIAAGVPRDLDALCRLTLNDDQGPTSPGDYARQVAPWPSRQVVGRPVTPLAAPRAGAAAVDAGAAAAGAAAVGAAGAEAPAAVAADSDADVTLDDGAADEVEPGLGDEAHDGLADHEPTRVLEREDAPSWLTAGGLAVGADGLGWDEPTEESGDEPYDDGWDDTVGAAAGTRSVVPGEQPEPAEPAVAGAERALVPAGAGEEGPEDASRGERLGAAAAGAGAAVAGALGTVGGRVSDLARRAVDKVSELSPDTERARPADGGDLEAPAPMVPAEPLTKDESKLALGIVAAFVILALVVGIYGVSRIGQGSGNIFGPAGAPATRTTTVAPSASGSAGTESPGAPEPLAILKVSSYDPQGDDYEHDELTGKVYDGNNDTGWYTESYSNGSFGGLKSGVGLVVDLGPNKKPQAVTLVIPNKSAIEVWVGPDARLEGATKIGEKDPVKGTVSFQVPDNVTGQYIILWYPKLYPDAKGDIRGWLNEVVVTG
ncbi:MAG TPA: hypothetical protein VFL46_08320 [Phycicoccus sp.]|nr:hypothetical protein [Phycicoccus sp.]